MDDLRRLASEYSTIAKRIDTKNKDIYEDREARKECERQIIQLMKTPQFTTVRNFQHQGFTFKVDPPGTWKGSWYLSKADLQLDIVGYWNSTEQREPAGCFEYICAQNNQRARDTDWRLSWTAPTGNQ
jgi:hypothetical protein